MLKKNCIDGLEANEEKCRQSVESATATATALVGKLGYDAVSRLIEKAGTTGKTIKAIALESNLLHEEEFNELISPEAVCQFGVPGVNE